MSAPTNSAATQIVRVRVFVDFWNFSLSVRGESVPFKTDWRVLGQVIASEAAKSVAPGAALKYEGMNVYGSYDPSKAADAKLKNWLSNILDKMPGVNVVAVERQRKKSGPVCPQCQSTVAKCPSCGGDMRGTEEKGVDTRIATDMISLAWINSYDIGVLVSSDRDFVPVAEFLQTKGVKIVHGSFPPLGSQLSQKCWANLDMIALKPKYERASY